MGKWITLWLFLLPALALGGCGTPPAAAIPPCTQSRASYLASPLIHQQQDDGEVTARLQAFPNPAVVGAPVTVHFPWRGSQPVSLYLAPAASDMVPSLDSTQVATVVPHGGTATATFVLPSVIGRTACGESFPLKQRKPFLLFADLPGSLAHLEPLEVDRHGAVLYVATPYRITVTVGGGSLHLGTQGMGGRFLLMSLVGPDPNLHAKSLGTAFVWKGKVSLTRKVGALAPGRYTLLLRDVPGPAGFLYQVPLQIHQNGAGSRTVAAG